MVRFEPLTGCLLAALAVAGCGTEHGLSGPPQPPVETLPVETLPVETPPDDPPTLPGPTTDTGSVATVPEVDPAEVKACVGHAALLNGAGQPSVHAAVAAAAAGDEVAVCPGVHQESTLMVDTPISLRGVDPAPDATVLTFAMVLDAPGLVVLQGLTIDFGSAPAREPRVAVTSMMSTMLVAEFVTLRMRHDLDMGFDVYGATEIRDAIIDGASLGLRPYGPSGLDVVVERTTFLGNHGGIQLDTPVTLTLTDTSFVDSGGCGAIVVTVGWFSPAAAAPIDIIASGLDVSGTRTDSGPFSPFGAVMVRDDDHFECVGCTWADNLPHDVVQEGLVHDQPGDLFL